MITIAINGFGRIGRSFFRTIMQDPQAKKRIRIAVINIGSARSEAVAHMFKYDTLMGTYPGSVSMNENELIVDGEHIQLIAETDPRKINWDKLGVDWVVESSGRFTKRELASQHIESGAQYVLITAPAKGEDVSIIPGVNEHVFDKAKHKIVSLGSCTTNAFITMLKILHDAFTIKHGFMTTIHAYTNTQVLLDVEDSDLRRSRAAALNTIPTSTGAAKMLSKIIPELDGLVHAIALRVPVAIVSLIDFSFVAESLSTVETIHEAFIDASSNKMKGIVDLTMEPLVSSDFAGNNHSVIIDGQLTEVNGNMGKVFGWYDNEWGYSMRLKDFLMYADTC